MYIFCFHQDEKEEKASKIYTLTSQSAQNGLVYLLFT